MDNLIEYKLYSCYHTIFIRGRQTRWCGTYFSSLTQIETVFKTNAHRCPSMPIEE